MDPLDAELRQLTPFPPDMQKAVQEYLRQASLNGFTVLGLALKLEPLSLSAVANVKQRDLDLVQVFRLYADIAEKHMHNVVELDITPNPNAT